MTHCICVNVTVGINVSVVPTHIHTHTKRLVHKSSPPAQIILGMDFNGTDFPLKC